MAKEAVTATTTAENTPNQETPATETVATQAQSFVKPAPQQSTVQTAYFGSDANAQPNATPAVTEENKGKVFTQEEVNKLIGQTRQETRQQVEEKFKDYDELKKAKTDADTAKLTADEQAAQRVKDLETQATTLAADKAKLLVEVSFKDAASDLGLPSDAAYKLADMSQAKYDEAGRITNAKELAQAVATQYPGLVKRAAAASVVNPGRGDRQTPVETDAQKRARLLHGGGGGNFWESGGVTMPANVGVITGE